MAVAFAKLAISANAASLSSRESRFGWIEPQVNGMLPSASRDWSFGSMVIGDRFVASSLEYGKRIAIFDANTGVLQRIITNPEGVTDDSIKASGLVMNGNRLWVRYSLPGYNYRLTEVDPATGEWIRSSATLKQLSEPFYHQGELRTMASNLTMLRWSADDLSPLPSYTFPVGSYTSSIMESFRNAFILGEANDGTALCFEESGQTRAVSLPAGYRSRAGSARSMVASPSYAAFPVSASSMDGWAVWNAEEFPSGQPRFYGSQNYAAGSATIYADRYLLICRGGYLEVIDLRNSDEPVVKIGVPESFSTLSEIHIANQAIWIGNSLAGVCRLPLPASGNLSLIEVSDAKCRERDGRLVFTIKATPAPQFPISVKLATSDGSAQQGVDYEQWRGTVVLTNESPSAQVVVPVLGDRVVETAESLLLNVEQISDGWCLDREGHGVILGTGFPELTALPAVSGSYLPAIVATDAGIFSVYLGHLYRWDPGSGSWLIEPWAEGMLSGGTATNPSSIIGNDDNRIVVTVAPDSPLSNALSHIRVLDLSAKQMTYSGKFSGTSKALLSGNKLLLAAGNTTSAEHDTWRCVDITQGAEVWVRAGMSTTRPPAMAGPDRFFGLGSGLASSPLEEHSFADGSLIRLPDRPLDLGRGWHALASDGQTNVITGSGSSFLHRYESGEDRYVSIGGMADRAFFNGEGVCLLGNAAVDQVTGAHLQIMGEYEGTYLTGNFYPQSYREGVLYVMRGNKYSRYLASAKVPAPMTTEISTSELLAGSPIVLRLTEAADFPLTLTIKNFSATSDFDVASMQVVVPAGKTSVVLPFTTKDDDEVEEEERHSFTVSIAGNGEEAEFDLAIRIDANDALQLEESIQDDAISAASMHLSAGQIVIGLPTSNRVAADSMTSQAMYPSASETNSKYGHAIASNATRVAVGAPLLSDGNSGGYVYLYNRTNASLIKRVNGGVKGSGFGSVLHMDATNFYVGAPGNGMAGKVFQYQLANGNAVRTFQQPGTVSASNRFGSSMVSDGVHVWIGTPGVGKGIVYQFNAVSGALVRTISAPADCVGNFGHALTFCGGRLVVSAPVETEGAIVYLLNSSTGAQLSKIPAAGKYFGSSMVGMGNDILAVGLEDAVRLYDVGGIAPRYLTQLHAKVPQAFETLRIRHLGRPGSLTSEGMDLGMVALGSLDPMLTYFEPDTNRTGFGCVLNLEELISYRSWKQLPEGQGGNAWAYALGGVRHPELETPRIDLIDGRPLMEIPANVALRFGAGLVIEWSDDLSVWEPVIYLDGSKIEGWRAPAQVSDVQLENMGEKVRILLPRDTQRKFLRARCIVPN